MNRSPGGVDRGRSGGRSGDTSRPRNEEVRVPRRRAATTPDDIVHVRSAIPERVGRAAVSSADEIQEVVFELAAHVHAHRQVVAPDAVSARIDVEDLVRDIGIAYGERPARIILAAPEA